MTSMIRKLPMLLILVLGMSAIFIVVTYQRQRGVLRDAYTAQLTRQSKDLSIYFEHAGLLAKEQRWDDVNAILETARTEGKLDFYVMQFKGHALWFGSWNGQLDEIDIVWPLANVPMATPQYVYQSVDLGNGYQLTAGFMTNWDRYYSEHRQQHLESLNEEYLYILLIVLAVGGYTLRDITIMVREIKRGRKGQLSKMKATSAETSLFLQGFRGYVQAVADLEAENVKLGRQVLPSLQKEIHSGRTPPYDFECTMVRTDINNFSTIFNTHNVTEFMATINEFFDEVSRIVARYGGLIHEFVGDEVIYYFKDEDHENSFAIALSAVRDINELAAGFNRRTTETRGYPFTVKSSLAHGKVRFGPLVGGFTVAGAVLIETVRILSHILEKDESVVYFDGINEKRIRGLIQSFERLQVKMKGYSSEIALYQYATHLPLKHVLETLNENSVQQLLYYRRNEDLIAIIESLTARPLGEATMFKAITALRQPHVAVGSAELTRVLRVWILSLQNSPRILSAAIMLYPNLIPQANFEDADSVTLKSLLKSEDRRVVANVVDVLTHFAVDAKVAKIRDDLRLFANSIVHEGRNELTPSVIKRLKELLRSKKAGEIASGLYALGELAHIHRMRDFAYYSAQVEFQALIAQLDAFAQHTTTMVRRQALIAARKAANEGVITKIRHHVRDSGSELLAEELSRYLDSYKSSAA